jgi:hypothetical protein
MKVSRKIGKTHDRWSTHMHIHWIAAVKSSMKHVSCEESITISSHIKTLKNTGLSQKIMNFVLTVMKPRQRTLTDCSPRHLPSGPVLLLLYPHSSTHVAGLLILQHYVRGTNRQAGVVG